MYLPKIYAMGSAQKEHRLELATPSWKVYPALRKVRALQKLAKLDEILVLCRGSYMLQKWSQINCPAPLLSRHFWRISFKSMICTPLLAVCLTMNKDKVWMNEYNFNKDFDHFSLQTIPWVEMTKFLVIRFSWLAEFQKLYSRGFTSGSKCWSNRKWSSNGRKLCSPNYEGGLGSIR